MSSSSSTSWAARSRTTTRWCQEARWEGTRRATLRVQRTQPPSISAAAASSSSKHLHRRQQSRSIKVQQAAAFSFLSRRNSSRKLARSPSLARRAPTTTLKVSGPLRDHPAVTNSHSIVSQGGSRSGSRKWEGRRRTLIIGGSVSPCKASQLTGATQRPSTGTLTQPGTVFCNNKPRWN